MTPEQAEKRRRIMQHSQRLGHCVCDPRKPCPCALFRAKSVCECAGERLPVPSGPVRLTERVRNAGCASKVAKRDLAELLAGLPPVADPRVVVGYGTGDDAGVIMLTPDTATILTVDVFTPVVDDPYAFGQIAAANSVSDIYAMGGTPQTALSVVGFPVHALPMEAMRAMLRGGAEKLAEAGVGVIGGHSINDDEVKFGYAVLGTAPAGKFVSNAGARPGDAVVLTKPLGTGLVAFAAQLGRAPEGAVERAAESMKALNRAAGELMVKHGAHAATDVTGFSLLGHLAEIARNSNAEVELNFDDIPLLPGAADLSRAEVWPGAVERNREAVGESLLDIEELSAAQRAILFSPETSGGLLVCLPAKKAEAYVRELRSVGSASVAIIGHVAAKRAGGFIRAVTRRAADFSSPPAGSEVKAGSAPVPTAAQEPPVQMLSCCASNETVRESAGTELPASNASEAFAAYLAAVNAPGALGLRHKKLIALALSVLSKCEPCVKINAAAARAAEATDAEVAEAVALGIAFGGAPAAMFYNTLRK